MLDWRLYLAQRLSALLMAPLVLGHLGLMIYAIQGGLSAEEILGRTRGSPFWAGYYGIFVAAAAVHGGIGLATVAHEWLRLARGPALWLGLVAGLGLAALGARAVAAVVLA